MILVGDKMVDYNDSFRLYLTTRNPAPEIPPDAASIISVVNFMTTKAGLTGQVIIHLSCSLLESCTTLSLMAWSKDLATSSDTMVTRHDY